MNFTSVMNLTLKTFSGGKGYPHAHTSTPPSSALRLNGQPDAHLREARVDHRVHLGLADVIDAKARAVEPQLG